jgi:DNA-binding transcriptional ArsR family regulator
MLRIHFTGLDLARTRLAAGPQPMWEILLSLHKLTDRDGDLFFDQWRRRTRPRLTDQTRWLCEIAPPRGYSPDFLTPARGEGRLEADLHRVLTTSRHRIHTDLRRLRPRRRPSRRTTALAEGTGHALHTLATAICGYHEISLAPYWNRIQARIHTDLTSRVQTLAHGGLEEVLATLHPKTTWRPPVLQAPYPLDRDLHLNGRGLLLVPSFFCWGQPITLNDPSLDPVLVYPITHDIGWFEPPPPAASTQPLAALLGRTRARMLTTIAVHGCTTSQLAQHTGVSPGSASQHTAVLRDAGLITTHRHGNHVVHTLTSTGTALITPSPG